LLSLVAFGLVLLACAVWGALPIILIGSLIPVIIALVTLGLGGVAILIALILAGRLISVALFAWFSLMALTAGPIAGRPVLRRLLVFLPSILTTCAVCLVSFFGSSSIGLPFVGVSSIVALCFRPVFTGLL